MRRKSQSKKTSSSSLTFSVIITDEAMKGFLMLLRKALPIIFIGGGAALVGSCKPVEGMLTSNSTELLDKQLPGR